MLPWSSMIACCLHDRNHWSYVKWSHIFFSSLPALLSPSFHWLHREGGVRGEKIYGVERGLYGRASTFSTESVEGFIHILDMRAIFTYLEWPLRIGYSTFHDQSFFLWFDPFPFMFKIFYNFWDFVLVGKVKSFGS